jgi:hypothetical protein
MGWAQRGAGFISQVDLATLEQVQAELKMTDEQKSKISELSSQLREDRRALFQGGGDPGANREKITKLTSEATQKCREGLDENQRKRLLEVFIQVNPGSALADPDVLKALAVTEEQAQKLSKVREEFGQAVRDAFQQTRDLPQEERRERNAKMRAEWTEKLLAELTDQQREQFKQMAGEKIEIDLSALRRDRL